MPKYLSSLLVLPMAFALAACPGDDTTGDDTTTTTPTSTGPTTGTPTPASTSGDPSTSGNPSTSGDPDTGDTGPDPDSGDTGPTGDACETYCGNAMTNCSGENAIYPDEAACMAACAAMPVGNEDDTEGNTAWCRAYHAGEPAMMDPVTHCPHASASGEGVCGSPCEGYCNQALANCGTLYPGEAECLSACAAIPSDGPFNATDGNSVQCRTYHASFPAAGDGATHCPHASSHGGEVCGELCEGYCNQAQTNCMLFADDAECLAECDDFPIDGAFDAVDGDSVQCRTYHASFPAAADAALHCPHADIDGGGVCGG